MEMDNTAIQLFFSAVLAIATVAYTIATVLLLIESTKARKLKTNPCVIPYLKISDDHQLLLFCLKNIGEGVARNVHVELREEYYCFGKQDIPLSQYRVFQDGVAVFPPQYELTYILGSRETCLADNTNDYIEFYVSYANLNKKRNKPMCYKLMFQQIGQNYVLPPDSDLGRIAYYLKDVSKTLKKGSEGEAGVLTLTP